MTKKFKKISSALVACAMLMSVSFSAFALNASDPILFAPENVSVNMNEGHGSIIGSNPTVAPEEYTGKQEVFDEVYPGSSIPQKDLFQGGGLSYENQWDFAVNYDYIVKEVDENGNETGRYVLDPRALSPTQSMAPRSSTAKPRLTF